MQHKWLFSLSHHLIGKFLADFISAFFLIDYNELSILSDTRVISLFKTHIFIFILRKSFLTISLLKSIQAVNENIFPLRIDVKM